MSGPAGFLGKLRRLVRGPDAHSDQAGHLTAAEMSNLRHRLYTDSASAICALIDGALARQASSVEIVTDEAAGHISRIGVLDEGEGMAPEMMQMACLFPEPAAERSWAVAWPAMTIGSTVELYSRTAGGPLLYLRLDAAPASEQRLPAVVTISQSMIPAFLAASLVWKGREWRSGTAVLISGIDRLSPPWPEQFFASLHQRVGFVFGGLAASLSFRVEGEEVKPIDPLFLTQGCVGYFADVDRAEDCGTIEAWINGARITLRTALLPFGFAALDRTKTLTAANANERNPIMRNMRGLTVSRSGRRITILAATPLFNFSPSDGPIRSELDFPPELDPLFEPSPTLEKVTIAKEVWTQMSAAGARQHLETLRLRMRAERSTHGRLR